MNKMLPSILTLILITSFVVSCGVCGDNILEDIKWFLISYNMDNDLISIIDDTEITATFDSAEGRLVGSAGCNTYFASYEVTNNKLYILELTYTEMACLTPEGIMEQEQKYLSLLTNVRSLKADETTLTISGEDGQQLFFTSAIK
jgi:heat shock protein HslJ